MRRFRLAALNAYREMFGMVRTDHLCEGWRKLAQEPEVISDLVTLGHLFEPDIDPDTGELYPDSELRVRAARKAMSLQLLARAEITHEDLNLIRQKDDDYDYFADDDGENAG